MAKPAHDSITATELVRNLSFIIDKVRMTGHSLYITKGSQTCLLYTSDAADEVVPV